MKRIRRLLALLPLLMPLASAAQGLSPADSLAESRADVAARRLVEAGFLNVRSVETPEFTAFTVENDYYKLPAEGFARAVQILEGAGLDETKPVKLIGTYCKVPEVTITYNPESGIWNTTKRLDTSWDAVRKQTLLNNSLYEGCSLGGYLMLADSTFQDWHFNTVWLDAEVAAGHWRPGIFMGFAKNLDFGKHAGALHFFGRGHNIEYLLRLQPRLTYATGNGLSFTGEAEYTYAGYKEPVGNLRLSLSIVYAF